MNLLNYLSFSWNKIQEKKLLEQSLQLQQKALECQEKMKKSVLSYHEKMQVCLDDFKKAEGRSNSCLQAIKFYRLKLGVIQNVLLKEDAIHFFEKLLGEPIIEQELVGLCLGRFVNGVSMWDSDYRWGRNVWFYQGYYVTIGYRISDCQYGYVHPSIITLETVESGDCKVKYYQTGFAYTLNGHHLYLTYEFINNTLKITGLKKYVTLSSGQWEELEDYSNRQITLKELDYDINFY